MESHGISLRLGNRQQPGISTGDTISRVTGISLGGYTSSLLAAVEDRLHFAIPNVPVTSLLDLVLEWFPLNMPLKMLLKASNTSVRDTLALQ